MAKPKAGSKRRLAPKLSYANVASTLALVVALGTGSAYAAHQLAPKSVGEKQLRPGAVTAEKIRKNAVTAPKIKALAVKQGKIAGAAVDGSKLAPGAVSSEKLSDGAVTTTKLATAAVTGAKVDEQSLSEVPSASRADTASFAESADPAAFAAVSQEGNVDPALSKGISSANVKQGIEAGIYCITVPAFAPRGAQVTPRYNGSGGVTAFVTIGGTGSCPSPQVEVQMHNGGPVKAPFYIALYR
jgi:hypothetical protein